MSIKLVSLDLDGTLLNSRSEISTEDKETIRRLKAMGIRVVINSGRAIKSIQRFEDLLDHREEGNLTVGFNGGVVCRSHNREVIRQLMMEEETYKYIINEIKPFHADTLIYIGDRLFSDRRSDIAHNYEVRARIPIEYVNRLDSLGSDISKILVKGSYENLTQIFEFMKDKVEGKCNMFFTAGDLLEFSHLNAHKGAGLNFVLKTFNIQPEEALAMGDNFNDITMLQTAGIGVAPAHADDGVKKHANYITKADNNHHAVTEAMNQFVFQV